MLIKLLISIVGTRGFCAPEKYIFNIHFCTPQGMQANNFDVPKAKYCPMGVLVISGHFGSHLGFFYELK